MTYLCEAILINDAKLWKRARKAWFNVVIEGIMKDYEAKKILAQNYIKNYKSIMSDFVGDDQETDISITNSSYKTVQLFSTQSLTSIFILCVPGGKITKSGKTSLKCFNDVVKPTERLVYFQKFGI